MNEDYVRRRLLLHSGQRFSPTQLQAAREDLAGIGVFSVVRVEPGEHVDPDGTIPILIDVTERPLHSVDVGAAYSTDLGVNATVGWHHRNLFGNAEQLNLTAGIQLGGNAVTKPGYNVGAQFIKPDFLARDQSLEVDLGAIKQSLEAYDQKALTQKIELDRKLSRPLDGRHRPQRRAGGDHPGRCRRRRYNLIGLPLSAKYDNTNSLLDPTDGFRATLLVTPTQSFGGSSATFVDRAAVRLRLFRPERRRTQRAGAARPGGEGVSARTSSACRPTSASMPAARAPCAASAISRSARSSPTASRPAAPRSAPVRWSSASASSNSYGVVAFVDAGQVTADGAPFTGPWRVGAGVGARYYTSIGPIRLDVAIPLNRQPNGDAFELYIGIGQAF